MAGNHKVDEETLRRSLGIPADAARVLVLAETSHWDPDWLYTADEYFERFVRRNLDLAIASLLDEPRRIYSIECVFFLRMYWDRCPDQREHIRSLVNARRLRLTHSAVTTADTLLPEPEAILRGFLLGQEWLRSNGMTQEPDLAYFSDSFGASPALPSLLQAGGFQRTAITRVDGMYFPGLERNDPRRYPRPGSTAERLLKGEHTLDFRWRDRAGAEVLCHWNAFSYGQGDLLAHRGFSRVYLAPLSFPDRSDGNVARRIRQFTGQLLPYSRTPYLFCPIGFDFNPPIPGLTALLDRYNQRHYPATGIWAVNAGLDDYLDLVSCHLERLPVLDLDPNPYWTGFYTSRPALKARAYRLVEQLRLAEQLSFLQEAPGAHHLEEGLGRAWWYAAVANHHDFITGTSPDQVAEHEQIPWLEEGLSAARGTLRELAPADPPHPPAPDPARGLVWSRRDGRVEIRSPFYVIELDEDLGGAILRAEDPRTHTPFLAGLSNDLVSYRDSGGLWRLGLEFRGGTWREERRASEVQSPLQVREWAGGLEAAWVSLLDGELIERRMWFGADSRQIFFRMVGRAARHHTLTLRFSTGLAADKLLMDAAGGVVKRPLQRVYAPTYWPFQRFVHLRDRTSDRGLAIYQPRPGAVSCSPDGAVELVALRNALKETAYGLFPLTGNPAKGIEKETAAFDCAIEYTAAGDWRANDLPAKGHALNARPWDDPQLAELWALAKSQFTISRQDVWALACKPASRGKGRIVRLSTLTAVGKPVTVKVGHPPVDQAYLCDARERDLQRLEVRDGEVHLSMPGTLASVRLLP
jgi:hypothetical protein